MMTVEGNYLTFDSLFEHFDRIVQGHVDQKDWTLVSTKEVADSFFLNKSHIFVMKKL